VAQAVGGESERKAFAFDSPPAFAGAGSGPAGGSAKPNPTDERALLAIFLYLSLN
jgi:hypothetical protein